jgi:hypothetical protein
MKRHPEIGLAVVIGIIVIIAFVVAANQNSAPQSNVIPTYIIETPKTVEQQVNPEIPVNGEKLMMPFGKPEVITFCNHGNRLYYQFYDSKSYGGVTAALWGIPDPKCPQE